jgi:AAA15 family ATPase/GTPase
VVEEVKVFPEEITIENFKSIRRITLRLKPGINLLVGPNRAGKTNILEAIYFLSRAISREELLKIPYTPHLPHYWSPEDIFFMRNIENPIRYDILLRVTTRFKDRYVKHYIKTSIAFTITLDRSSIEPAQLTLDFRTSKLIFTENSIDVFINREYLDKYLEILNEYNKLRPTYRDLSKRTVDKLIDTLTGLKKLSQKSKDNFLQLYSISVKETKFMRKLLLLDPSFIFSFRYIRTFMIDKGISLNILLPSPSIIRRATHVGPIPLMILYEPSDSTEFKGYEGYSTGLLEFYDIVRYLENVLGKVLLLKHPDIGAISEPQAFGVSERLDVRVRNLPQILYRLAAERRVDVVEEFLREVFGDISLGFKSVANRVFFVVREGSVELPPPNVADGIIKVLAIATAVELKPSILLIDEIENSLHVEAIQKVFDFLNNLEIPVVVATHSPAIIDLVDLDRVVIVSRGSDGSTSIEYVEDVEAIRKKLLELGISHSEYILYGRTVK